eukprot:TRINITY_DN12846_c0_g1_i1.p1 TRINITY_DN12846_c0_g1~~TRINITY_DN12846_c0_g1_i1.p1  ORF type:complete len:202 (+),score=47.60 TRINITY_DN12846_c0_g1_i1:52-657(+)
MACGFGAAAVRALSKKIPGTNFRGSFSLRLRMSSKESRGSSSTCEPMEDNEDAPEHATFCNRSITFGDGANERLLERDVYADSIEQESEDEHDDDDEEYYAEDDAGGPMQALGRTRTLWGDHELPDVSNYLDAESIEKYNKMYLAESDSSNDASGYADESDAEEMYSGLLRPCRTAAHRDFPHPTEYLTKKELVDLWSSFS